MEQKQAQVDSIKALKQTIVGLDELMHRYKEKDEKLKKTQQVYKDLKFKYDEANSSVSRFQLEIERTSFKVQHITSKHNKLECDYKQLEEQKNHLEQKYNKHMIESQSALLELQNELQLMKELQKGTEELSKDVESPKKNKELEDLLKKLKKKEAKFRKENDKLLAEKHELIEDMKKIKEEHTKLIDSSQSEKRKFQNDINELKLQITTKQAHYNENLHARDREISKLNAEVLALRGLKEQLKNLKEENKKLNNNILLGNGALHEVKPPRTRNVETQTETSETNANVVLHENQSDVTELSEPEDESVQDIMSRMKWNSRVLSPMPVHFGAETVLPEIPTIIITPSTPVAENVQTFEHFSSTPASGDKGSIFDPVVEQEETVLAVEEKYPNKEIEQEQLELITAIPESDENYDCQSLGENICDNIDEGEVTLTNNLLVETVAVCETPIGEETSTDDLAPQVAENNVSVDKIDQETLHSCDKVTAKLPGLETEPPVCTATHGQSGSLMHSVDNKKVSVEMEVQSSASANIKKVYEFTKVDDEVPVDFIDSKSCAVKSKKAGRHRLLPGLKDSSRQHLRVPNIRERILKNRLRVKKVRQQDSVLRALQVLKRSKINFTISNESTLPLRWRDYNWLNRFSNAPPNNFHRRRENPTRAKTPARSIRKLSCPSKSCRNINMLLDTASSPAELLGFFNVKQEVVSPTGEPPDRKPDAPVGWLKESLSSDITPENLLEKLAELVSEKLREKNPKRKRSARDSEFCSETETELERLIEKPGFDVLERNKMLLKKAKYDLGRESASATALDDGNDNLSIETAVSENNPHLLSPSYSTPETIAAALEKGPSAVDSENSDSYDLSIFKCVKALSPLASTPIKRRPKLSTEKEENVTVSHEQEEHLDICRLKQTIDLHSRIGKIDDSVEPFSCSKGDLKNVQPLGSYVEKVYPEKRIEKGGQYLDSSTTTIATDSVRIGLPGRIIEGIDAASSGKLSSANETQPQVPKIVDDSENTNPPFNTHRSLQLLNFSSILNSGEPKNKRQSAKNSTGNHTFSSFRFFTAIQQASAHLSESEEEDREDIEADKKVPLKSDDSLARMEDQDLASSNSDGIFPKYPRRSRNDSSDSKTANILNASTCINEFLQNENKMTEEIESFMTKFDMDSSFIRETSPQTEKSKRNAFGHMNSKVGSKKMCANDILSFLPSSEDDRMPRNETVFNNYKRLEKVSSFPQSEVNPASCIDIEETPISSLTPKEVPDCPMSPELHFSPAKNVTTKIIPLERSSEEDQSNCPRSPEQTDFMGTGKEPDCPLSPELYFSPPLDGATKIIPLERSSGEKQSECMDVKKKLLPICCQSPEAIKESSSLESVKAGASHCTTSPKLDLPPSLDSSKIKPNHENEVEKSNDMEARMQKVPSCSQSHDMDQSSCVETQSVSDCPLSPDFTLPPPLEVTTKVIHLESHLKWEQLICMELEENAVPTCRQSPAMKQPTCMETGGDIPSCPMSPELFVSPPSDVATKIIPLESRSEREEENHMELDDKEVPCCPMSPELFVSPPLDVATKIIPLESRLERKEENHMELKDKEVPCCPMSPELFVPPPLDVATKIVPLESHLKREEKNHKELKDKEVPCPTSPELYLSPAVDVTKIIPVGSSSSEPTEQKLVFTDPQEGTEPIYIEIGEKEKLSSCLLPPELSQNTLLVEVTGITPLEKGSQNEPPSSVERRKEVISETQIGCKIIGEEVLGYSESPKVKQLECTETAGEDEVPSCPSSPDLPLSSYLNAASGRNKREKQSNCKEPTKEVIPNNPPETRDGVVSLARKKRRKKTPRRSSRLSKATVSSSSEQESEDDNCERLINTETKASKVEDSVEEPIEKKKGRPRKIPPAETPPEKSVVEKVVRKRGRPRKYPRKESSAEEEVASKRNCFEDDAGSNKDKTDVFNEGGCRNFVDDDHVETCATIPAKKIVKPKQKMTRLQSNIKRQMREKQRMFQFERPATNLFSNTRRDDKINATEAKAEPKSEPSTSEPSNSQQRKVDRCDNKKINIVQNILIQAGHTSAPVDVHKTENDRSNSESVSSQKAANKPAKKRVVANESCDILSQILGDMDRGKPKRIVKRSPPKKLIPQNLEDVHWRRTVMDIAEVTHSKHVDVEEKYGIGSFDGVGMSNGILKRGMELPAKLRILVKKLMQTPKEDEIPDHVITEFKKLQVEVIIDTIIHQVSRDIKEEPDTKHFPAPLMTRAQRIFLILMLRLEQENMENLINSFLSRTKHYIFKTGCALKAVIPLTRLFLGVCRLRGDVHAIRKFCCEAFFHIGDQAVPVLFAVLTSWIDVIPMEADVERYPMTKVLVQLVHLKTCNRQGYNLIPLKALLNQFYGYPKERWNCDTLFEEVCQEYLRNPTATPDYAIRLFCRNKDTKWVYKKINEFFKPLIYKIPTENVNFKATVILLMGKICRQFRPKEEFDEACLVELNRWFRGLLEDDSPEWVRKSVEMSIDRLPKKRAEKKKRPNNPENRPPLVGGRIGKNVRQNPKRNGQSFKGKKGLKKGKGGPMKRVVRNRRNESTAATTTRELCNEQQEKSVS